MSPSSVFGLAPFVILRILHKITITITVALDHLAGLYTPTVNSEVALSRLERAAVAVFGESNRAMVEEVGCIVDDVSVPEERRELVEEVKSSIVETLVNERASMAMRP
jgi:hypothetical protein